MKMYNCTRYWIRDKTISDNIVHTLLMRLSIFYNIDESSRQRTWMRYLDQTLFAWSHKTWHYDQPWCWWTVFLWCYCQSTTNSWPSHWCRCQTPVGVCIRRWRPVRLRSQALDVWCRRLTDVVWLLRYRRCPYLLRPMRF